MWRADSRVVETVDGPDVAVHSGLSRGGLELTHSVPGQYGNQQLTTRAVEMRISYILPILEWCLVLIMGQETGSKYASDTSKRVQVHVCMYVLTAQPRPSPA
jgi:hypothetical protein